MAYHLAHNLPDFKVEVIMKTPDEWEEYSQEVYNENRWAERRARDREIKGLDDLPQIIWRKSGELIGNTSDFLKLIIKKIKVLTRMRAKTHSVKTEETVEVGGKEEQLRNNHESLQKDALSSMAYEKRYGGEYHGQEVVAQSDQEVLGFLSREVNKMCNAQYNLKSLMLDTYEKFVRGHEKEFDAMALEELMRVPAFMDILDINFFKLAQDDVFERMYTQRFGMKVAMTAKDRRAGFSGLGDCFCLTDPLLEDNPIILASDRFVEGPLTDREAVKRLRHAIAEGEETTELFLNYKLDGTPFWNMVFIAPLRKKDGSIRYFIGGQVDVTHSLEVDKQLPTLFSSQPAAAPQRSQTKVEPLLSGVSAVEETPPKTNLFSKAWRWLVDSISKSKSRENEGGKVLGMEAEIVGSGDEISAQVVKLYDTYSKYLVLHPTRGEILFAGWQLSRTLQTQKSDDENWMIGADFYELIVGPKTPKQSAAALRHAHQNASPASEVVMTPETPDMKETKMMAHMTPLRDGNMNCGAVVVVLVSMDVPSQLGEVWV
ncbi:hypothetical protein HDU67_001716 [Dinochytrium kinnereticum]|nr:hypothetical protein HDU67_001716 [Dinochytrium kinnereticum]